MEGGEQLPAMGCWYQRPRVGSAGVAEELGPSEFDLLQRGACVSGRCGLFACLLGLGDGGVVYLDRCGGDGVDLPHRGAGEGVGHHIVHSTDVSDVAGELGQVAEVSALPGRPRLHCLGQGVGQRLVVGVEGEWPPFQHEPEVPDSQYAGE